MFGDSGTTAVSNSERRFHVLVDSIEDYAIYMLDQDGHVLTWNRGATLNKGYSTGEVIGRHFRMFFVPEDIIAGIPEKELFEASRFGRCLGEGWRLRKNGERFWASFVITAIQDDTGRVTGFAKVTRDLGEQKRRQDATTAMQLALQEERDSLNAAAECTLDALYICTALRDVKGEIEDFIFTYVNSNAEKAVGMPRTILLGGRMCDFFPSNKQLGLFDQYKEVVRTGERLVRELQIQPRAGDELEGGTGPWMRVQAVRLRDGVAITTTDIDARKREEERSHQAAYHDYLTGLPNRSLLEDRIGQAMERAKRYQGRVAVYMIDLDSFKLINDTFGHATGDAVLVSVASRLTSVVRATDSVIRMGGDEFVVVMPDIALDASAIDCAEKIRASLQQPMEVHGHEIHPTCSIGIAVYPDSGLTRESLLEHADAAMYQAKRTRKNRCAQACASDLQVEMGNRESASVQAPMTVTRRN